MRSAVDSGTWRISGGLMKVAFWILPKAMEWKPSVTASILHPSAFSWIGRESALVSLLLLPLTLLQRLGFPSCGFGWLTSTVNKKSQCKISFILFQVFLAMSLLCLFLVEGCKYCKQDLTKEKFTLHQISRSHRRTAQRFFHFLTLSNSSQLFLPRTNSFHQFIAFLALSDSF